ncbi:MAG: tRNA 2-thiocytidine biosynthesis protein TtcA [Clostridiales bacterium]|jgi:tRNA(Ile)-lysidine synthase TilS/MesJ|nr:tRNA 2-thiocytidine biosynthesis protein TtcA [Clostridiales bacterium]
MKNLIGNMRRTIQEYAMISEGDRVAVGLSGGKDSMALLYLLKRFQQFSPFSYHLEAITIDPGFENFDTEAAKTFCKMLEVPYTIVPSNIAHIVFDVREEKNPCALCANMRRGFLAETMRQKNLNILALGHHQDDALSTFMMNMLYAGKLNTLEYKSHLSRTDVTVVRPFLNAKESDIIRVVTHEQIPVVKSPCPMDRNTNRETMTQLLSQINRDIPHSRTNMVTAMRNEAQCNLFKNKIVSSKNQKNPLCKGD